MKPSLHQHKRTIASVVSYTPSLLDFIWDIATTHSIVKEQLKLANEAIEKLQGELKQRNNEASRNKEKYDRLQRRHCTLRDNVEKWRVVAQKKLSYISLTGHLCTELGLLTMLMKLDFNTDSLTGHLPSELGRLTVLTESGLGTNSLTGHLPSELGHLTMLNYLYLDINHFNGTIPSEFALLTTLSKLTLHDNNITGTVPQQLCSTSAKITFTPPLTCPCSSCC